MKMNTILLACACVDPLAFGSTPALSGSPMMGGARDQAVNGDAVQKRPRAVFCGA